MMQKYTLIQNIYLHPYSVFYCEDIVEKLKKLVLYSLTLLVTSTVAVPSPGLGLHLDAKEMQVAIEWWLGIDISSGSKCALCPHSILDPLGHHAVTCKFGGDVVSHYNRLRDTFVQSCHFAGLNAKIEVGSGLAHDHQHTSQLSSYYSIGFVHDQQLLISLWSHRLIQP